MIEEYIMTEAAQMPPTHPGAVLREDVIPEMNISVTEFAKRIGVSRQILHRILAETSSITPEMALRMAGSLGMALVCGFGCRRSLICGKANRSCVKFSRPLSPFASPARMNLFVKDQFKVSDHAR